MRNGSPSGMKQFQLKASIAGIILLSLLYFLPVIKGFSTALTSPSLITSIIYKPVIRHSLIFTIEQAAISTLLSALIGIPAGLGIAFSSPNLSRSIRSLYLTVFMAPSMVVVMGFTSLYGRNGLLSTRIPALSILGKGFPSIIAAHTLYNAPLIAVMVYASIASIPREYWDLLLSTAKPLSYTVIKKILVPYIVPGVLSGSLLTFIYCFMSFAIPLNLGGPQYSTLEVNIYMYYKILQDEGTASAIALIQYIILLTLIWLSLEATASASYAPVTPSAAEGVSWSGRALFTGFSIALLIYTCTPIIGALYYSFYNPLNHSFTLEFYRHILSSAYDARLGIPPFRVILNTLYFAFMTILLSLALSTLLSVGWKRINEVLVLSLLAVSPVTLGLGLLRSLPPYLPVWTGIVLAHTFAALPLSLRTVRIGLERVSWRFVEAGLSYGETPIGVLFRVSIPIALHSYILAAAFAAAVSFGEFGATLFLRTIDTTTLAVAIYQYRSLRMFGEAYAASGILLLFTFTSLYIIARLGKGVKNG
ncbi:MAG: ABC transporter permease subunit [Desulfurococcales archaeon]|nr:ABC transporter permease subunit [Desulfurococcales archaeon]